MFHGLSAVVGRFGVELLDHVLKLCDLLVQLGNIQFDDVHELLLIQMRL